MYIEEPETAWNVNLFLPNKECIFVCYPANETACMLRDEMKDRSCSFVNCKFAVSDSETEIMAAEI